MKIKYFYTLDLIIAAFVALVFIVLGSVNDFLYSSNFAIGDSVWSQIICFIFTLPMYFALALCFTSLLFVRKTRNETFNIICIICMVVCAAVQILLMALDVKEIVEFVNPSLGSTTKYIIAAIVAVALNLVLIIGAYFITRNKDKDILIKNTLMLAITIAVLVVLTFGLKYLWGRPRYNYLTTFEDPAAEFRAWWQLNPISPFAAGASNFTSFPSGHVIKASSSFVLCGAFIFMYPALQKKLYMSLMFYGSLLFCFAIGLLRVWSGCHFISDVSFSLLISLIISVLVTYLVFRDWTRKKKELVVENKQL